MRPSQRILIVKLSAFGDVVQTLPMARALKEAYPKAIIGWLISRANLELVEGNPYIDRIFIFERRKWGGHKNFWKHHREIWKLIREIRNARFGIVLDFQGLFRSAFFTFLSGSPRRIGFANAREFASLAYTEKVKVPSSEIHAVDRYALMARRVTDIQIAHFCLPPLWEKEAERWRQSDPLVVLVPGARWVNKRWPACYFSELADLLIRDCRVRIALAGAACDVPIAREILASARFYSQILDFTGRTSIRELAALLKNAALVVSNDSGPMHLAAALNTPTLAIFGPTDPKRTGPYGEHHVVLKASLPCMPCLKRNCTSTRFCMNEVSPHKVLYTAQKMLIPGAYAPGY